MFVENAFWKKLQELFSDEFAQVSAEMIIVVAAVLAVAVLLVSRLLDAGKTGSQKMEAKADELWKLIDDAS